MRLCVSVCGSLPPSLLIHRLTPHASPSPHTFPNLTPPQTRHSHAFCRCANDRRAPLRTWVFPDEEGPASSVICPSLRPPFRSWSRLQLLRK